MDKLKPNPTEKTKKRMQKLDKLILKGNKGNKRAAKKAVRLARELDLEYRDLCKTCKLHTIFGILF